MSRILETESDRSDKKKKKKKPAEKKPAEKKPAEKKPAEKKPAEKKPAEKKEKTPADTIIEQDKAEKAQQRRVDAKLRDELDVSADELKELKKKLKKAEGFPERGIETWFRLASRNLYTRRRLVDTKASLLITINSLILSVVLTVASRFLEQNPMFAVAIVPLVTSSLLSIGFAVVASKPNMLARIVERKRPLTAEEVDPSQASLMTFDEFYRMSEAEYEKAVTRLLDDRGFLYSSIKRDIYRLGVQLNRRYIHIEHAYGTFLLGLTLASILFIVFS